jgi:1-aminocyclopropane-1-carboxylate deaminase
MSFSKIQVNTERINCLGADTGINTDILRLDQLHPVVSGNKWFKLRYYLEEAIQTGKTTVLTYGGAWSNHIVATAAATASCGLRSIGIIRGEEPRHYSATLLQAKQYGMQLVFTSREQFKKKEPLSLIPDSIHPDSIFTVNEGGYGPPGAAGMATALGKTDLSVYTHIVCAAGTGTMMAGLIQAALPGQTVIGIPVLKGHTGLEKDIRELLQPADLQKKWELKEGYHFGGYAKKTPGLLEFMNCFFRETGIPTDFVYTGKLLFALQDLIQQHYFPAGSRLLVIHSGGLQGNASLPKGSLIFC